MSNVKLNFSGRGNILFELHGDNPIAIDFDDVNLATMLFKFILDHCEDGIPVRTYSEEEKKMIHMMIESGTHEG